jgi:hypothetical protein
VPKGHPIAYLIVKREWWLNTVGKLMQPYQSGSGELHRVRGPLVNQDIHGIWIGEVPSNLIHLKKPGQPVFMKLFVPWSHIVALGVIDDPAQQKAGFAAEPLGPDSTDS